MFLRELFNNVASAILVENLTKGADNVMKDKRLVAGVAAQLRDDFSLPFQSQSKFKKMSDEDVTRWFVEQLDRFERQGYEGVAYGRNGQYHMWVANNYVNGADIWEDIEGEIGPALRDFTILKNRNMLLPQHQDIQKYKGVKFLHRYMVQHYEQKLEDARKNAAMAQMLKSARSIVLADVPEYKVYLLQNRQAAIAFGKGATFCTANSNSDYNFKAYSAKAPLLGLLPNEEPKQDTTGRLGGQTYKEKFQFDSSNSPNTANFRDNLDRMVDPDIIKERFPYLLDDIIKGFKANKAEIEEPSEETLVEKLKYDVDKEIQKLKTNLAPYWTDEKRPAAANDAEADIEVEPELDKPTAA